MKKAEWAFIRSLADSKVVKSSYVWLFVVPIAAKMLVSMDEVIHLTIFDGSIELTTKLPFSWQLLFFSACAFTIGNILYSIFCPDIFKKYKNYSEFKDQGRTLLQVHSSMKNMCLVGAGPNLKKGYPLILTGYFKHYCNWRDEIDEIGEKIEKKEMALFDNVDRDNLSNVTNNAFYFAQEIANTYSQLAIISACFMYCIGLVLVGVIGFQNILYVLATITG